MPERKLHGPVYDLRALGFQVGEAVTISGAGSGIGRATAIMAATSGLRVAVWDVNSEAAERTAAEIGKLGGMALAVCADVSEPAAVRAAWDRTLGLGDCRYLVNNAGPPSIDQGRFIDNIGIALGSVELVTSQWIGRVGEGAASMVNIASIAGNFQGGGQAISPFYAAAKTGITGYTRWLATHYGGMPRANAVAPGVIITPRTAGMLELPSISATHGRIPLGRLGFPEEIASAVLFLLSPAASYINGVLLPVDGGTVLA